MTEMFQKKTALTPFRKTFDGAGYLYILGQKEH